MVNAIIFDLGGTLFHSETDIELAGEAQWKALKAQGYEITKPTFESISEEARKRFVEKYSGDYRRFEFGTFMEIFFEIWGKEASAEDMAALDRVFWEARLENQYLDESARSVLRFCRRQGLLLGVITNGNELMTRSRLESAGIADDFDVVLCSTEIQAEKSTVEPFRIFLDRTGLKGSECIMVGDRLDEDMWANEVGMSTIHLASREPVSRGAESAPDYTIESLDELKSVIENLI